MIIRDNLITSSNNITNKEDLFNLIADLLLKEKLIDNKNKLVQDLKEREQEGSTAFENGLMIPHARTGAIKDITLVVVDFNDSNFDSLDNKPSNFAVAILVPDSKTDDHLKILSKISLLFSDTDNYNKFKNAPKAEKIKQLNEIIETKEIENNSNTSFDFVGVTACAAGIAHTYMSRNNLYKAAEKLGFTIKIETRGAMTENRLSKEDIANAKYVVIAADVTIPKKQFAGKKIYETDTNSAIQNAEKVLQEAQQAEVWYGKGESVGKLRLGNSSKSKNILGKAIMSALSFMIPVTVAGGILMAIPNAIASGGDSTGGTWSFPNSFTEALWTFGHIGLLMMVPILAMFLAYKLGGKPAIPAALIGGYFINDGTMMSKFSLIKLPDDLAGQASAGFLGGLAVGIIVGGWLSEKVLLKFVNFAKVCFDNFNDLADLWIVFNEPLVICECAYVYGYHQPLINDFQKSMQAAINIMFTTAKVIELYKTYTQIKPIGTALNLIPAYSLDKNNPVHNEAANYYNIFSNNLFMYPAIKGIIQPELLSILKKHNINISIPDSYIRSIKNNTVDFLGVNYYTPIRVKDKKFTGNLESKEYFYEEVKHPSSHINKYRGWEIYGKGLYDIALTIKNDFNNIPWMVQENGIGIGDEENYISHNVVQDNYRIDFYKEHLYWLHEAIKENSNCFGYHVWTFIDNWSWLNAFKNRYGLFRFDLITKKILPKLSSFWFMQLIENKNLDFSDSEIKKYIEHIKKFD